MEEKKKNITFSMSAKTVRDADDLSKVLNVSVKFTPKDSKANFTAHYSNLLTGLTIACMDLYKDMPILRPVTDEERELNIYVFKTDDATDLEHKVYKHRKNLYDQTVAAFNNILTQMFPDILYIDQCKEYQQDKAFEEGNSESFKEYKEQIKELTDEIRKHYDDILNYVRVKSMETAQSVYDKDKELEEKEVSDSDA